MEFFENFKDLGQKLIKNTLLCSQKMRLSEKYSFPSSISKAKVHMKAARIQSSLLNQQLGQDLKKCPCCNMKINDYTFSVRNTRTTPLFDDQKCYISSSVSLFFTLIKCIVLLLLIRIILVDVFNIVTSLGNTSFCTEKCSKQLWSLTSLINKFDQEQLIYITNILSLVTICISLTYFIGIRKLQYKVYCNIDQQNQTQDDFTIFVQNVPILNFPQHQTGRDLKFRYEEDLQNIFQNQIMNWLNKPKIWDKCKSGSLEEDYKSFIENKGYRICEIPSNIIKRVNLCYDVSKIDKIRQLRQKLMTKYQVQIDQNSQTNKIIGIDQNYDTIPQQISYLNDAQIQLSQKYLIQNSAVSKITNFCGSALISFKYQHYRDYILDQYTKNKKCFSMKGEYLQISKAPTPSDILWQNLVLSKQSRKQRVFTSFVILFVFLMFAFGLILGSDRIKQLLLRKIKEAHQFQETHQSGINWAQKSITMGITIITLAINYVLQLFAYGLSKWQKHQTIADQKLSLIMKLVASQFLNTALIFLAISIIDNENNFQLLGQNGLVYQISYLLVMSGLIQIFMNMLNFSAIIRFISLKVFQWGVKDPQNVEMFQIKLNKMYEYTEFDIAQRYSYYLVQLYTVSFYAYIVPLCVPAVALILLCQFWVDKYNLFKRSSLLYELNYSLSRNILKIAECSITIFSIGALYFSTRISGEISQPLLIAFFLGITYLIVILLLPVQYERKFFQSYEKCEVYSYDQCKSQGKFSETYWKKNPATMLTQQIHHNYRSQNKKQLSQTGTDGGEYITMRPFKNKMNSKKLARRSMSKFLMEGK